jgi:cytochrome c-type biogenesis protein CcmH
MIARGLVLTIALLLAASPVCAAEAAPAAADPQLERRVMSVAEELRCLVCQNQTIADSNAPLAVDLRDQVREKIREGMSEQEIVDYMVARYGDFVRYRPPLKLTTVLLWFGPLVLLLGAVFFLIRRVRAGTHDRDEPLSDHDRARAAALLSTHDK